MIGALISILSLNLTLALVQNNQVAQTLVVTNATVTTPIAITCPSHNIPLGRVAHGVVTGIEGTEEANGLWVLTPVDSNTLTLSTFTPQGVSMSSVGVNAYASGGQVQIAFPDYQILLGRRWVATAAAVVSPRIVFVPTDGKKWGFEPYGGVGSPASLPAERGSLEQQSEKTQPQQATEFTTFEVYVQGCANPPAPDFGDFDATQAIVWALYTVIFDANSPARGQVLHESWPSQSPERGTQTQRGQMWRGILEFQQPVTRAPLSFVPAGVSLVETVLPAGGGSGDATIITIDT